MRELIEGPLTQREVDMKESEFLLDTVQGLKWEALSFELPESIMDRIKSYSKAASWKKGRCYYVEAF